MFNKDYIVVKKVKVFRSEILALMDYHCFGCESISEEDWQQQVKFIIQDIVNKKEKY